MTIRQQYQDLRRGLKVFEPPPEPPGWLALFFSFYPYGEPTTWEKLPAVIRWELWARVERARRYGLQQPGFPIPPGLKLLVDPILNPAGQIARSTDPECFAQDGHPMQSSNGHMSQPLVSSRRKASFANRRKPAHFSPNSKLRRKATSR